MKLHHVFYEITHSIIFQTNHGCCSFGSNAQILFWSVSSQSHRCNKTLLGKSPDLYLIYTPQSTLSHLLHLCEVWIGTGDVFQPNRPALAATSCISYQSIFSQNSQNSQLVPALRSTSATRQDMKATYDAHTVVVRMVVGLSHYRSAAFPSGLCAISDEDSYMKYK